MSTTTGLENLGHPIARFTARVHGVLDGLVGVPAWSMTPGEQRTVLVELARAQARIEGLRLRVLAAADTAEVAAESAASSTAAWVAQQTRQTGPAAHADVKLAQHLALSNHTFIRPSPRIPAKRPLPLRISQPLV